MFNKPVKSHSWLRQIGQMIAWFVIGLILIPRWQPVQAAWYNVNWNYRKKITIDNTKVSGSANLSNFPVLINLSSDNDLKNNAQADGDDILFTSSDGTTKLDHEIEKYVSSTGELVAWVEVPTVSYNTDTDIYMYYGNASATSQQNATGVWDSNYIMVQHLQENGNGTAGEYVDSTTSNNDGQGGGGSSTQTPSLVSSGKADGAQSINRSETDYIKIPDSTSLNNNGNGFSDMTISAWVKTNNNATTNQVIIRKDNPFQQDGHATLVFGTLQCLDTTKFCFYVEQPSLKTVASTTSPSSNTWYYVTVTIDNNTAYMYVDGVQENSTSGLPGNVWINTDDVEISSSVSSFDGYLDEIRVSNTPRSSDWIKTEYNNQSSPSTFYTLGSQEQNNPTFEQSGFRWFKNSDSTNVGDPLASENSLAYMLAAGDPVRLRLLIHVASANLSSSGQTFKLQFAEKSGTCDTAFTGESYADISSTTAIAFYDNSTPADDDSLTTNANDPTHSTDTVVAQSYEEANNFTNSKAAINAGQDGMWDFALYDKSGVGNTSYCIRAVKSTGVALDTYSQIPEIVIPPSLSFTISAVGANTTTNGITTSEASTVTTLPFGNIQVNSPKYVAHQLYAASNSEAGYTVNMRFLSTAIFQGTHPSNVIDAFNASGVSWTTPKAWSSPTGTTPNVDTGWIGANTSDTRVTGWSSAAGLFGPVSTVDHPVMQTSSPDSGSTIYVTYALEVNIYQPTDLYTGQLVYTMTPTY